MRLVIGLWTIEQSTIHLPIQPSSVEGPISVANKTRLVWATVLEQCTSHGNTVESRREVHDGWVTPCDLFVAKVTVEVVRDPCL